MQDSIDEKSYQEIAEEKIKMLLKQGILEEQQWQYIWQGGKWVKDPEAWQGDR